MENWFAAAAAGVLALFGATTSGDHRFPPQGRDGDRATSTREFRREAGGRGTTTAALAVNVQCVSQAVTVRESALNTAMAAHTQEITAAYSARATALSAAYSQTGNDAIKQAVKSAWQQFSAGMKVSKKSWQNSRETAWQTFKTAVKSCGSTAATVSDSGNAGGEMSE